MKESTKDLFEYIFDPDVDAIALLTNNQYTISGLAVMNNDVSKKAAERWVQLPKVLGKMLKIFKCNIPFIIGALNENGEYLDPNRNGIKNKSYKCLIFSFPSINKLNTKSNLQLIKQSAFLLKDYADQFNLKNIILQQPGEELPWEEVRTSLEEILDDRFIINRKN